jgi:hypothetical protein
MFWSVKPCDVVSGYQYVIFRVESLGDTFLWEDGNHVQDFMMSQLRDQIQHFHRRENLRFQMSNFIFSFQVRSEPTEHCSFSWVIPPRR